MSLLNETRSSGNIAAEELQAAEKVAFSFAAAFKYYSLYPAGHAFAQNHLLKLQEDLENFLKDHKSLRLDIEKYTFYYKGQALLKNSSDEGNPAYLLTRDRILYLEFSRHIQLDEITSLFDIFNVHRNPIEEVDGDIATSLWHVSFNNIHYEAGDVFAMEAIDFELAMFSPLPDGSSSTGNAPGMIDGTKNSRQKEGQFGNHDGTDQHYAGFYGEEDEKNLVPAEGPDSSSPALLFIAKENDLAELTNHEKLVLESYLETEEERNAASDTADVLLIILSTESKQIEFASILDFLEYEFFEALMREEYSLAQKICKNIENISKVVGSKKPWAITLINIFFASLAKEERYYELPLIKQGDYFAVDADQFKCLLTIFEILPAEILHTLTALAGRTAPDNLRQRNELLEIIEKKCRQAPQYLQKILAESDESTCLFLFPVIEGMENSYADKIFLQMTRHAVSSIRRIGMDGLFKCSTAPDPDDLVHLLGDEDEKIRQRIMSYLGTLDKNTVEKTFIQYLQSADAQHAEPMHILECYRLLSSCLAESSVEFLRGVLLGSKITQVFSKMSMIHKKGAAYALLRSGREDARQIIQKGSKSVRPDVRHVCQKVLDLS